jgi:C1A family cysteine protease
MINWVSKGKVTAVQNQGQCGSCWTFSASGAISSAIAIANNSTPVDYSEQQIIDCDTGGNGCKGGDME